MFDRWECSSTYWMLCCVCPAINGDDEVRRKVGAPRKRGRASPQELPSIGAYCRRVTRPLGVLLAQFSRTCTTLPAPRKRVIVEKEEKNLPLAYIPSAYK